MAEVKGVSMAGGLIYINLNKEVSGRELYPKLESAVKAAGLYPDCFFHMKEGDYAHFLGGQIYHEGENVGYAFLKEVAPKRKITKFFTNYILMLPDGIPKLFTMIYMDYTYSRIALAPAALYTTRKGAQEIANKIKKNLDDLI